MTHFRFDLLRTLVSRKLIRFLSEFSGYVRSLGSWRNVVPRSVGTVGIGAEYSLWTTILALSRPVMRSRKQTLNVAGRLLLQGHC